MSTSREISQKASPLSRGASFPVLITLFVLVAVAGFCRGGQEPATVSVPEPQSEEPVAAAEPTGSALLDSGPHAKVGLLMLPANALSYHQGQYLDGSTVLKVQYTEEAVALPDDWLRDRCGDETLHRKSDGDTRLYAHQSAEGWSVFFEFPADYALVCPFVEEYLQKFRFFRNARGPDATGVRFPAVVELPRY